MDKIDNLDINTLSDNDKGLYLKDINTKGVYIKNIKTKGVYIKDELIAGTDFDWMKLFPSLTNNLVDKSLRNANGCAILNFSSLRIYKRDNGIYHNYYCEPHSLNWFDVPKTKSEFSLHRDGNKRLIYIRIIFASYADTYLNLFSIVNGVHFAAGIDSKIIDVTVNGPDLADYKGFNVVVLLFDD